jgi:hypothetical protein
VDSTSGRESRVLWSFWLACGLAATGAIAPLLLAAGGSNRIAGAAIPFGVAAVALAANALTYQRGRPLATGLYFIAGLALVYGMLSMIAVPLRLAVLGTCPPAPALCPVGFERPMTGGEDSGLAFGVAMGTLAILVGFFGLLMLFRFRTAFVSTPPPVRRDAPVTPVAAVVVSPPKEVEPAATAPSVVEPEAAPATAAPATEVDVAAVAPPPTPRKPRAKRTPGPAVAPVPPPEPLELTAPEEPLELAAPEERLELPAPSSADEPTEDTPSSS